MTEPIAIEAAQIEVGSVIRLVRHDSKRTVTIEGPVTLVKGETVWLDRDPFAIGKQVYLVSPAPPPEPSEKALEAAQTVRRHGYLVDSALALDELVKEWA